METDSRAGTSGWSHEVIHFGELIGDQSAKTRARNALFPRPFGRSNAHLFKPAVKIEPS